MTVAPAALAIGTATTTATTTAVATLFVALAFVATLVAGTAHAGTLVVRDADGSQWMADEDPAADANDFLLKRLGADGQPDLRFGTRGQSAFSLGANNDAPASVRVDSTHRIWMVGASLAGNQPQPVIARFLADGTADPRWGVQGKVQLNPNGVAVRPNDLLPLADGSVLVAGEAAGQATPKAVVFHLRPDGSLDVHFGTGGVWQRAGDADASTATSLAAGADGSAAVAIAVRGAKPGAELWSLGEMPPKLAHQQPLDDNSDGEDLRVRWVGDHWTLGGNGGPTGVVAPASLGHAVPAVAPAASAASAADDLGEGGLNPFASVAASAPPRDGEADDGMPWGWIGLVAVFLAGAVAFGIRGRRTRKREIAHRSSRQPRGR